LSKKLVSMVLAGIFLIAFGYLAGAFSISPVSAQKKIEYKVVSGVPNSNGCQKILNNMAAEGWEFHSAVMSLMIFKK